MTVYNGRRYVGEAIESILGQPFRDFELLIINDGSRDDSLAVIRRYSDDRIRVIDQQPNQGIRAVLNRGLREARTDYIAIMDQDDVAHPQRLEQQVAFMETHPDVGLCGTDIEVFGERSMPSWIRHFESDALQIALLFENPFCHPSVILRRQTLAAHQLDYPDFPYAEEYALWVKLSRHARVANLPEKLLRYRTHAQQVSQSKNDIQCRSTEQILLEQLRYLGIDATRRDLIVHKMLGAVFNPLPRYRQRLEQWTTRLRAANRDRAVYPAEVFAQQVQQRLHDCVQLNDRTLAALPLLRRLAWQFAVWRDYLRAGPPPPA